MPFKKGVSNRGQKHPCWKGGKYYIDNHGYIVKHKWVNGKRTASLYHQEIYCEYYNLKNIPKGFMIHHRDGDKLNNRITNLEMITRAVHINIHTKETRLKPHTLEHKEKTKRTMKERWKNPTWNEKNRRKIISEKLKRSWERRKNPESFNIKISK